MLLVVQVGEQKRYPRAAARWLGREQFLEGGKTGLAAANGPRRGPSGREAQLAAQVAELARALGEAHVEPRSSHARDRAAAC